MTLIKNKLDWKLFNAGPADIQIIASLSTKYSVDISKSNSEIIINVQDKGIGI